MTRYDILVRILDRIREEARGAKCTKKYAVDSLDLEEINAGRSRSFIHLYIKVMFGILEFSEREHFITDGSNDGGIDGYYIDRSLKKIYLIQSKFRVSEKNFQEKNIQAEDLLSMDIDNVLSGNERSARGEAYNGKICQLIREISEVTDIARYNYHVVLIANCSLSKDQIRRLTGGYNAVVFDFSKSYEDLVFPVVSGTFFQAEEIVLQIDLSNKSAGARTSYQVSVNAFECEITVLFAPTLEIARVMDKYKNSILEYNPRSYLDLEGGHVNNAIRKTITQENSNEFALLNNGITILSDQTDINERVGKKNTAQLRLVNPQIINGGQTAYTLSRVYREFAEKSPNLLAGKEVLVKVITLTPTEPSIADSAAARLTLIDQISLATNRQTAVIDADRLANEAVQKQFQQALFKNSGLLYERKRGEFSEGINAGYIHREDVVERNLLTRIVYAVVGQIDKASQKKVFIRSDLAGFELNDGAFFDKIAFGYELFRILQPNAPRTRRYKDTLAKVYIGVSLYNKDDEGAVEKIQKDWQILLDRVKATRDRFWKKGKAGDNRFAIENWLMSGLLTKDARSYVADTLRNNPAARGDAG